MRRLLTSLFGVATVLALIVGPVVYAFHEEKQMRNFRVVRPGVLYRSARMTPAADGMSCYGEVRRGGDRKRDRQEALQSTIVIEAIPRYPPQRVLRAAVVLRGGPGSASLNFHTKRDTTPWGRSSV